MLPNMGLWRCLVWWLTGGNGCRKGMWLSTNATCDCHITSWQPFVDSYVTSRLPLPFVSSSNPNLSFKIHVLTNTKSTSEKTETQVTLFEFLFFLPLYNFFEFCWNIEVTYYEQNTSTYNHATTVYLQYNHNNCQPV